MEIPTLAPHLTLAPGSTLPVGIGGTPVATLCVELLRQGLRVLVVTLCAKQRTEVIVDGPQLRLCVGPYRPRPRDRALDGFAVERRYVAEVLRREAPLVVHAHWAYEFALGALASGLPHVVTAHDAPLTILRLHRHAYRLIRAGMAYAVLRRARLVTTVSPYVAQHLRRYGFVRGAPEVIPNGLAGTIFEVPVRQAMPGRAQGPVYASALMGWSGRKNGEVALHAFARVRAKFPHARLLLFGAGHGPGEAAEAWAHSQNMAEGVAFIGQIPHPELLERLRGEVDVLVHPSLEESHGLILVEAMALGVPVIGGRHSGAVPWTLDDGRGGVLVEVRDPEAVAGAMLRLAEAGCWAQYSEAGRISARRFHIREVAQAYLDCYARARAAA